MRCLGGGIGAKKEIGDDLDNCLTYSNVSTGPKVYFQKSRHHIGQYCLVCAWNINSTEALAVTVSIALLKVSMGGLPWKKGLDKGLDSCLTPSTPFIDPKVGS